jgi:hypothetical protein
MTILCDFDGTVIPRLTEIGYTDFDTGASRVLKKLVEAGHNIVLWTCRNESEDNPYNYLGGKRRSTNSLQEAIGWFEKNEIPLFGVNGFPGEDKVGMGTSRKPLADLLIDDVAAGIPIKSCPVKYISAKTGTEKEKVLRYVDWDKLDKILKKQGYYN